MALRGPQGEVNGVLLDNGTILRFPPDQGAQLTALVQPRQTIVAEGTALTNALGTVVDVQQLGTSRDRLVPAGPAAPSVDDRGPTGLRRFPMPLAHDGPQPPPPGSAAPGPGTPAPPAS